MEGQIKLVRKAIREVQREGIGEAEVLLRLSTLNGALQKITKTDMMGITTDQGFKGALQRLAERYKSSYDVQLVMGNVLYSLGLLDESVESYKRAAAVRRTREALNNLGVASSWAGRGKEAVKYFKEAIGVEPGNSQTWFNLGKAYHRMEMMEDALNAFLKVVEIDPGNKSAWNNIGVCYRRTKKLNEALGAYERALAIDERYVWALDNRGVVLMEMGKYEDALESIEKALRVDPRYEPAIINRRECERLLKKRGEKLTLGKAAQR